MDSDCRLYLITPPRLPPDFPELLAAALDAGDIAAVRLQLDDPGDLRAAAETLRPIVQRRGVAFVLGGDAALAAALKCDGVHLADGDAPAGQARHVIGDLQLGVFCGLSRDRAMDAGDEGADYVAFGPFGGGDEEDYGLIEWWAELMELPVVAEGAIAPGNCAGLVRAGADFLAVERAVWDHPGGPAEAVRAFTAAIEAA
jgi:thiamine-phosphate pyrophosphorylase